LDSHAPLGIAVHLRVKGKLPNLATTTIALFIFAETEYGARGRSGKGRILGLNKLQYLTDLEPIRLPMLFSTF
jgi:hypothetical protein